MQNHTLANSRTHSKRGESHSLKKAQSRMVKNSYTRGGKPWTCAIKNQGTFKPAKWSNGVPYRKYGTGRTSIASLENPVTSRGGGLGTANSRAVLSLVFSPKLEVGGRRGAMQVAIPAAAIKGQRKKRENERGDKVGFGQAAGVRLKRIHPYHPFGG